MTHHPITALYVPGDEPAWFDKAVAAGADIVIIDIEGAVTPKSKPSARAAAAEYLSRGNRQCPIHVRINGRQTPWWQDDLKALAGLPGLDGLRLPKIESATDVSAAAEHAPRTNLHALVETAAGVEAMTQIARAGIASIGLGEADLASEFGVRDDAVIDWIRTRLVIAARAASIPPPMMSVWTALSDNEGLARSCRLGRGRGFVGRMAIHPRQLPHIRGAFTPTDDEIAYARLVLTALAGVGAERAGVAVLPDGSMVDAAMREGAQRVLILAAQLAPADQHPTPLVTTTDDNPSDAQ